MDSFMCGPSDLLIEQINNSTGAVQYLHHDQQGSTRLLKPRAAQAPNEGRQAILVRVN